LLGLRIVLTGRVIESADFWEGIETAPAGEDWLTNAKAVVLPAWIEPQPRRLLRAVASIPVIASEACGIADVPGVTTVPEGDAGALVAAISKVIGERVDKSPSIFLKPVSLAR
jgi:glycosyltransferase involved in cell wall biosynthesis